MQTNTACWQLSSDVSSGFADRCICAATSILHINVGINNHVHALHARHSDSTAMHCQKHTGVAVLLLLVLSRSTSVSSTVCSLETSVVDLLLLLVSLSSTSTSSSSSSSSSSPKQ